MKTMVSALRRAKPISCTSSTLLRRGLLEGHSTAYVPSRLPEGLETGLYEVASFSPEVPNFPNGCHVCEVEIDPETGASKVLRYCVVDDVGTVIQKLTLEGQITG